VDGVYWILAVEWVFYLAMAALILVGPGRRERATLWVLTGWAALSVPLTFTLAAWRASGSGSGVADILLTATIAEYAPLFASGALLFHSRERSRLDPRIALTLPAAAVTGGLAQNSTHAAYLFVPLALFTVLGMRERTGWLRWRPLQFLGMVSYSWYLLHQNIGYAMMSLTQDRVVGMILGFALTLVLAWGLYELVEKRFGRWLRPRLAAAASLRPLTPPARTPWRSPGRPTRAAPRR